MEYGKHSIVRVVGIYMTPSGSEVNLRLKDYLNVVSLVFIEDLHRKNLFKDYTLESIAQGKI